jgi:hypothetical protein
MRRLSVFEVIGTVANEKVAVHAALFVEKHVPDNRFTRRTINLAKTYMFWEQRTYDICHECYRPVIGNHAEITGHATHAEPNPIDEDWWQRVMAASSSQLAVEHAQDPAIVAIMTGWEQAAKVRADTITAEDHDEEDHLGADSDETYATPPQKEN